jgi:beta-galactosidase
MTPRSTHRGTAVPDEQQWRDVKLAADGGCSLWRPGHSTSSIEFVDACDAYGVMVVQPSGEGEGAFSDSFITDYKKALKTEIHREMIVRDRNHPSILSWEANNGAMQTAYAQSLRALCEAWDPIQSRAQADRTPNEANGDILGCTLNGCELLVKSLHPSKPAWGSEYWGKKSARFAYDFEIAHAAEFINNWRKSRAANAFGIAQWYFAETVGENGDCLEGKPPAETRSVGSSMMDFGRIPTFLYYVYKAAWWPFELKPVVALAHHWNRSGNVRVNAMSNCPKVRLSVNDTVIGEKAPNPWNSDCSKDITGTATYATTAQQSTLLPHQVFWDDVTWEAGTLKAECLDDNGQVVATDTKVTSGVPRRIGSIRRSGPAGRLPQPARPRAAGGRRPVQGGRARDVHSRNGHGHRDVTRARPGASDVHDGGTVGGGTSPPVGGSSVAPVGAPVLRARSQLDLNGGPEYSSAARAARFRRARRPTPSAADGPKRLNRSSGSPRPRPFARP